MLPLSERQKRGKKLRHKVTRVAQSKWSPKKGRSDPVAIILAANSNRLRDLVPIKMGRMAVGPFAFFRGAAPLMAADLATLPVTGIEVQICGDAHVRNLGAYAAPEGHLVFDINDFDETTRGPWEWDLKRLATSLASVVNTYNIFSMRSSRAFAEAIAPLPSRNTRHSRNIPSIACGGCCDCGRLFRDEKPRSSEWLLSAKVSGPNHSTRTRAYWVRNRG